jgi:hypothetical protein
MVDSAPMSTYVPKGKGKGGSKSGLPKKDNGSVVKKKKPKKIKIDIC